MAAWPSEREIIRCRHLRVGTRRELMMTYWIAGTALVLGCALAASGAERPKGKDYTNSLGMRLVRIEPGSFMMGVGETPLPDEVAGKPHRLEADFDERPVHEVTISKPFYMGVYEVTNAQYEQFDAEHRRLRGKLGFSKEDDEAVVFVSWHDAVRFCEWLSNKEGLPYRLPTEAEWEYACRAGTTTPFHTGDMLPDAFHKNVKVSWFPDERRSGREAEVVPLTVGQTPPNAWGLHDMHGNVEEWCCDWYGPYEPGRQTDPVGRADGDFRVARGGSHSTEIYYLRSANRMGTLPEDKSWLIGFRVVLGTMPKTKPLPVASRELYQRRVKQRAPRSLAKTPDPSKPYFRGPRRYVNIPPDSNGPMFSRHNHDPALVQCPNGDLLAIWYTCVEEPGRELGILASRLRYGQEEWDPASPFWDAPDRNDHAPALWLDGEDTIYQFTGLSAAATWGSLATIMRTSKDNGVTWSRARLINPEHELRHMPVESVFRTREGFIILPCDAVTGGYGGTAVHVSRDNGQSWADAGGKAAGIHAGVVQLKDGRLMAFGRGDNIDGMMPKSISADMGKTWTYSASVFPPISGGQRLVLTRLNEGPLFFASFAKQITITDASGTERTVAGLFGALSFDEGETWPVRRLISDDGPGREVGTTDGRPFTMSASTAEPRGYLSVCQTPDGVIQLISSRQHYAFNLAWLRMPPPPAPSPPPPPTARALPLKRELATVCKPSEVPGRANPPWSFTGAGVREADAVSFPAPGVMKIDTGAEQRVRWKSDGSHGFAGVDAEKGFTVEIKLQVLKSTSEHRGIDFEAHNGANGRYFITITATGVYWHDDDFIPLAEGLDNSSAMHIYRMAVREDGVVQIYRDGELLGVRPGAYAAPKEPHIQWGEGAIGSEADALVGHVAYDLSGPAQPRR